MAWEQRGARRYYYYKKRIGDKVVSEYRGSTPFANALGDANDAYNNLVKQRRVWSTEKLAHEREPYEVAERQIAELQTIINLLTNATLYLNGYHQHKGQWRLEREKTS